jgi:hypothetical protein
MKESGEAPRGLLVLADGVQAAFAAGAVAELARRGVSWRRSAGAGLGAQLAALAVLAEGERRWRRQAELGCPLFESLVAATRRQLRGSAGVAALPDAWQLDGWLDPAELTEHIAPEAGGLPDRLAGAGAECSVAVVDLRAATAGWRSLETGDAGGAGASLFAAAAFPAGWGPHATADAEQPEASWGGTGVVAGLEAPWGAGRGEWDVVCGFPCPPIARPALGTSLLELVQRRDEWLSAAAVLRWLALERRPSVRLIAPTAATYRVFAAREAADLGVEYPLPWERNGELVGGLVRFGAFVVGASMGA